MKLIENIIKNQEFQRTYNYFYMDHNYKKLIKNDNLRKTNHDQSIGRSPCRTSNVVFEREEISHNTIQRKHVK